MNQQCTTDLLARARRLVAQAKAQGIRPKDQKAVAARIAARQRSVRAGIHRRRDGATKLLMRRRAEVSKSLAGALREVGRKVTDRRNLRSILNDAMNVSCAELPKKPPRSPVERAMALRRLPLRFIVEF